MAKKKRKKKKLPPTRAEIEKAYEAQVRKQWEERGYEEWHAGAWRQVMRIIIYRHGMCGAFMQFELEFAVRLVLDPYLAAPHAAWCEGCNREVETDECEMIGGKRMHHVLKRMRRNVPTSFRLVRFVIVPIACLLAAAVPGWAAAGAVGAGVGALVGLLAGLFLFGSQVVTALRRRGKLWE